MNYFEFLEIKEKFDLDEKELRIKYLQNAKKFHPDFVATADESKKSKAIELSSTNTLAYETLKSENSRIEYLLEIHELWDENSEKKSKIPQDFMFEMMEFHENIEEAESENDAEKIRAITDEIQDLNLEIRNKIKHLFDGFYKDTSQKEYLEEVKENYLESKYILRILKKLSTFAIH